MKPVIGLDCDVQFRAAEKREMLEIGRNYTQAVELAGGVPVLLPVVAETADVDAQLDLVDGLVLIGGADLAPGLYAAASHPKTRLMHPARQTYDLELARAAIRRRIPILGVCGGLQLINVICGGDLVQHLPDTVGPDSPHRTADERTFHEVTVEPGTRLAGIVGAGRLLVNSAHHQGIGRVGTGLRIAARSPDGVIEALETEGEGFLVCVQWHPERLAAEDPRHLALFRALVEAAADQGRVG